MVNPHGLFLQNKHIKLE